MGRIKLSKEERIQKMREAKRGWASTRQMKHGAYVDMRKKQYEEKKKAKQEAKKKEESKAIGKPDVGVKRDSRLKVLIVIVVIAVIVYFVIKALNG